MGKIPGPVGDLIGIFTGAKARTEAAQKEYIATGAEIRKIQDELKNLEAQKKQIKSKDEKARIQSDVISNEIF